MTTYNIDGMVLNTRDVGQKKLSDYISKGKMSDCCHYAVYEPTEAVKLGANRSGTKWIGVDAKCLWCYEFCKAIPKVFKNQAEEDLEIEAVKKSEQNI